MQFPALLADGEWATYVFFIVSFAVYVLNKLFGGEAAKKGQQRPRPAPLSPPQPPPERQRVEDEVAEFLRRATQSKESRSSTSPPAPPKPSRAAQEEPAPVRRLSPKRDVDAPLYDDEPPTPRGPMTPSTLGQKKAPAAKRSSAARAKDVDQADEAMEAHIHQARDHKVGDLTSSAPTATSDQQPATGENRALSVGELLRDPHSIRDAIVVSEILRRPTHRW